MANRLFKQFQLTLEAGVVKLYGSVTTSTSGTIASSTGKGFSITKTATKTGRYTVTLQDKYYQLLAVSVTLIGSTDAAYTTGKGDIYLLRNNTITTTNTFEIQWADADGSAADAEIEDGASFLVEVTLKNSTAF